MIVDPKSPKPIYVQIKESIIDIIKKNNLKPHDPLPSEMELVNTCGTSRMTARRALEQLENEGIIYRVHGKGSFVSEPKINTKALTFLGLRNYFKQIGYETTTKVISFEIIPASITIANNLSIKEYTPVYKLVRIRQANEIPVAIDTSYLPVSLFPGLNEEDIINQSLYKVLQDKYDLYPTSGIETLEARNASNEESLLLSIKKSAALITLSIVMNHYEQKIEYAEVLFRGDKFKISNSISR